MRVSCENITNATILYPVKEQYKQVVAGRVYTCIGESTEHPSAGRLFLNTSFLVGMAALGVLFSLAVAPLLFFPLCRERFKIEWQGIFVEAKEIFSGKEKVLYCTPCSTL